MYCWIKMNRIEGWNERKVKRGDGCCTMDNAGFEWWERGCERWVWLCDKILWCVWTGNKIGAEGARALSESLKNNTMLTALDLSGTYYEDDDYLLETNENIGEEGAIMIIEALKTNSTLTLLNLSCAK